LNTKEKLEYIAKILTAVAAFIAAVATLVNAVK